MMKLGEVREFKKRISVGFKNWSEKRSGEFLLIAVFSPGKYPSWTLSFEAGDYLVKKTISEAVGKEIFKRFKDFEGDLFVKITETGAGYSLELVQKENPNFVYILEGKRLIRRKKLDLDDIPF